MKILSALVISISLAGSAHADDTSAAAAPDKMTFVKTVASANKFEIDSSKLATAKSTSEEVKAFASQMITDHTRAAEELGTVLRAEGDVPMVDEMATKEADMLTKLEAAEGAEFDAAYVSMQTQAHEEAVALFRNYSAKPDDKEMGEFAAKTLPTLEMHLEHVKKLAAK